VSNAFFRALLPAEAKKIGRIAVPVFFGQMSQMLMGVADTIMTGRYSTEDMAAVALATSLSMPVSLCGIGLMLVIAPFVAQRTGAGERGAVPHLLRQGILLALAISAPLAALLLHLADSVSFFGMEGALGGICAGYLRAVTCGLPGMLLYIAVRGLPDGDARVRPSMLIAFGGLILNIPCNYILIYGMFGLPAMGGVGCGAATALVNWFMAAALIFYTCKAASYRDLRPLYAPLFRFPAPDFALMARILRIGLPGALAMLCEMGCFAAAALLLAPLGATVVAGHQAAMNFCGVLFMLPLSLGITCTIRVGRRLGEARPAAAGETIRTAVRVGLCLAFFASAGTVFFRHEIAALYSGDPHVRVLAAHLLLYAALFQPADFVQVISAGALRGYNDTRFILTASFAGYWCLGLPAGFVLARTNLLLPAMGAAGFWAGFMISAAALALALQWRLRRLRRLGPQETRDFLEK
jgi:MATE family multidrug resistance protein